MKFRYSLCVAVEREVDVDNYPANSSIADMLAIDEEGLKEDPFIFMDSVDENCITIKVEVVNPGEDEEE